MIVIANNTKNEFIVPKSIKDIIKDRAWNESKNGQLSASYDGQKILIYWIIIGCPFKNYDVDHVDRNPKNNLLDNLRVISHQKNRTNQNMRIDNTSGYKGVSWDKSRDKWICHIKYKGTQINLGRYDNLIQAAMIYDKYANKIFDKNICTTNKSLNRFKPKGDG